MLLLMIRLPLALLVVFFVVFPARAQPRYQIVLKGGHVIDPRNQVDAVMDVAVADGKIAAVRPDINPADGRTVVDVSGLYVTPGLIDNHVHVFATTGMKDAWAGDNSVLPDGFSFRSGVTTMVDAGSSGWRNFEDFRNRVIDRARTRVFAMLNIVGLGMMTDVPEQNVHDMDAKATADMAVEASRRGRRHQVGALSGPGMGLRRSRGGSRHDRRRCRSWWTSATSGRSARTTSWSPNGCGPETSARTCSAARCRTWTRTASCSTTSSRPAPAACCSTSGTAAAASCSATRCRPSSRGSIPTPSPRTCIPAA